MSAIDTNNYGRVFEHLVGDLPVFGGAALAMDVHEDSEPISDEQAAELKSHASMMSGRIVTKAFLDYSDR